MNYQKVGTYSHKIYTYHTKDFQGNITADKLISLVLDSAGSHADENGFGKDFMISRELTWVLSRLNLELHLPPQSVDGNLIVTTWIHDVRSAFSTRMFEVQDTQKRLLASAVSLWSVIDIKNRRMVPINKIVSVDTIINPQEVQASIPHKLVFEKSAKTMMQTAQYTDLDYNGHVNSNRYLQWGLNAFSLDFWKMHYLQQIELAYNHEVYYGDAVEVCRCDQQNYSEIEIYNATQQQTACKMQLHFVATNPKEK